VTGFHFYKINFVRFDFLYDEQKEEFHKHKKEFFKYLHAQMKTNRRNKILQLSPLLIVSFFLNSTSFLLKSQSAYTPEVEKRIKEVVGGFVLKGKRENYFFHRGGNPGYTCMYFGSMHSGKGVAIMCNANGSKAILKEIINSVANVYSWIDFPLSPIHKKVISLATEQIRKYYGKYEFNGSSVKIFIQNNNLVANYQDDTFVLNFTSQQNSS